jgi:hypothetical protein
MNSQQSLVEKEIQELIKLGDELVCQAAGAPSWLHGEPVTQMAMWARRGGQLIQRLYGRDSEYFRTFTSILKDKDFSNVHSNNYQHLAQLQAVFRAVEHEIKNSLIGNIRGLLQADVFADFVEMAEHLLNQKYKDAAAVVTGAVLEDTLRKIADKHSLPVVGPQGRSLTIEPLNIAIAKAGVYNPLIQRQVSTWGVLRNTAAHGNYAGYD